MPKKYQKFILIIFLLCLIGAGIFCFLNIQKKESAQTKTTPNLKLLTSHSSPQTGENWVVSFETTGASDLTITPKDQDTIGDLDFVSLTCDSKEKTKDGSLQILNGDAVFYSGWKCNGTGQLTHLVNIARKHTLKFQFGEKLAFAHNNPDSVTDSFTDESKIAATSSVVITGGQAKLATCGSNGTACSAPGQCCSNYCVDNVCCNSACSGTCQACVFSKTGSATGTCANITSNTDPDSECASTCKVCQSGSCGNATVGTDPQYECATTSPPAAGSCKDANCSGADYGCGYLAAGEQSQPACKRCNGSSYDPVNITDDTGDSEGSNQCDADNGDCYRCSSGSCTYQTVAQDLFNECPGALGVCFATTCSGSSYSCGYLAINSQPTGCTGCKYCNGSGVCVTCSWDYQSGPITGGHFGLSPVACYASTNGSYRYLDSNMGYTCTQGLYTYGTPDMGDTAYKYKCTCQ